jgi:hypothetical protein
MLLRNEVDEASKWSRKQDDEVINVTGKAFTTQEHLRPSGSRPLSLYLQHPATIVTCNIQVGYSTETAFNGELKSAA